MIAACYGTNYRNWSKTSCRARILRSGLDALHARDEQRQCDRRWRRVARARARARTRTRTRTARTGCATTSVAPRGVCRVSAVTTVRGPRLWRARRRTGLTSLYPAVTMALSFVLLGVYGRSYVPTRQQ